MTHLNENWYDTHAMVPLNPASSFVLSGPSGSGKTTFIRRFLEDMDGMYSTDAPIETLFCYNVHQDIYDVMGREIENITFMNGLPTSEQLDKFLKDNRHRLLILDDMQNLVKNSELIEHIFTAGCHHRHLSIFYVTQNLFQQGTNARTITLNTFYHLLFPSTRDRAQIAAIGRQLFWGKSKSFVNAYEDVVNNKHGYLLVDNSPGADPAYRLRTQIFPGEDTIIYQIQ
jgi:GTPase SAR1 family protein